MGDAVTHFPHRQSRLLAVVQHATLGTTTLRCSVSLRETAAPPTTLRPHYDPHLLCHRPPGFGRCRTPLAAADHRAGPPALSHCRVPPLLWAGTGKRLPSAHHGLRYPPPRHL